MPRRQDRFRYGTCIPPTTARVVDTAVEILGDPDAKVEQVDGGLPLKPSRPLIRRSVHRVGTLPAKG